MPKKKSPSSLYWLCLETVALTMEHIWDKDDADTDLDQYHAPNTEMPFSELAGSHVQDLLEFMGESEYLNCAMLQLLLVPRLRELELSSCPKFVNKDIARIITVRCKNLSSLGLQYCKQLTADTLTDLVKGLPCLTKLNLSYTKCNTQVLSAVGSCCRRIRELEISDCKRLSPTSFHHLAYDPTVSSFCCPALQRLVVLGMGPRTHKPEMVSALAFVLLALPSLKFLFHDKLVEAVCLIYHQLFDNAQIARGFPSLEELARCRVSTHTNEVSSKLKLSLREIHQMSESTLPAFCAVCPHLAAINVLIGDGPGLFDTFLSWRHLTHLSITCRTSRDLRDILPMMVNLGAQLQSFSFRGFFFEDNLSFHNLLSYCQNVKIFEASLLSPLRPCFGRKPDVEALGCDVSLAVHKFPQLTYIFLRHADLDVPFPPQHATMLRAGLVSLLKHSPCLEYLELIRLPFSLDEVFEEVLEPPGTALLNLRRLFLAQNEVSIGTIHLLLSSDNQLSYLSLEACPDIQQVDYDELLDRTSREGFELNIVWV